MSGPSAFDKQQLQEISHDGFSGLLEHLNLPPVVIRFIKKNKRNLQIGIVATGVVVASVILYNSYRLNRIQDASTALALAMKAPAPERHKGLVAVVADFQGTPSAHWANAELAHELMKEGKSKEAVDLYATVRKDVRVTDPLYALLTFGLAQANETAGVAEAAAIEYKALQKIDGYEGEGFIGLARVLESQGKAQDALAVYEQYQATFTGQNQNAPDKIAIDEKIARLKAQQ